MSFCIRLDLKMINCEVYVDLDGMLLMCFIIAYIC